MDQIRWRITTVAFYHLKEDLQRHYGHVQDKLADIVFRSGLIDDTKDKISRDLIRWAQAEERYEALVEKLGGMSCLILLPSDISSYT